MAVIRVSTLWSIDFRLIPPPRVFGHDWLTCWAQAAVAGKVAAGALTGAYESIRFKNKTPGAALESLAVLGAGGGAKAAIGRSVALARGNVLARCGPALSPFGVDVCRRALEALFLNSLMLTLMDG